MLVALLLHSCASLEVHDPDNHNGGQPISFKTPEVCAHVAVVVSLGQFARLTPHDSSFAILLPAPAAPQLSDEEANSSRMPASMKCDGPRLNHQPRSKETTRRCIGGAPLSAPYPLCAPARVCPAATASVRRGGVPGPPSADEGREPAVRVATSQKDPAPRPSRAPRRRHRARGSPWQLADERDGVAAACVARAVL